MPNMPRCERGYLGGTTAAQNLTPAERQERARIAANARWAKVGDRTAETAPARAANRERFYAEADRQGIEDPVLREQMARAAERAELSRLRLRQLRKRRLAAEATQDGAAGDGEAV